MCWVWLAALQDDAEIPTHYKFVCDCAEVNPDEEEEYFAADYLPEIMLAPLDPP